MNETTSATIQLIAFGTQDWAKYYAAGMLHQAVSNPRLDAAQVLKLQAQQRKLARGPDRLSDEQICDIYWAMTATTGHNVGTDIVFTSFIGRLLAVNAMGCGDGVLTVISYGEFGLVPSSALDQTLIELRKTVQERAAEEFGDGKASGDKPDADSSKPTATATSSGETRTSGPKPTATGSGETNE